MLGNRVRGFTLVELLIVLTVISIFLGIVGFRYSKQDSISMD
ncbi:MAG TPA: type II secretion system protein, partial [bacterium]|nr:type II secretion system protein [bacterium]HEX67835.1 type II secretion system protein [bacterium]